jgi:hypothetical protein
MEVTGYIDGKKTFDTKPNQTEYPRAEYSRVFGKWETYIPFMTFGDNEKKAYEVIWEIKK